MSVDKDEGPRTIKNTTIHGSRVWEGTGVEQREHNEAGTKQLDEIVATGRLMGCETLEPSFRTQALNIILSDSLE